MLNNRVYLGEAVHKGTAYPGEHDAIVTQEQWDARAFRYQRMLDAGTYRSIGEMAAAEKLDPGYLRRLIQLTLLAPDLIQAIMDGFSIKR